MSSYFDQVEEALGDAVQRLAHRAWYTRPAGLGRARPLAVALAALVVATPAVGAVTNWFGIGAPQHIRLQAPTVNSGRVLAGTSRLLSLRVRDPRGGPPWGLRIVRTTRDDTCIQVGRVEDGRLGSLGIDGAWKNDRLFHPFTQGVKADPGGFAEGQLCGSNDGAGHAFVNVSSSDMVVNAYATASHSDCPMSFAFGRWCSPRYERFVFMGLLGPDATSVTYEAPNGTLRTKRTSGSDGAYLLVLPASHKACDLYLRGAGPCPGVEMGPALSPWEGGAVKAVSYSNGQVCRLTQSQRLLADYHAYVAYMKGVARKLGVSSALGQLLSGTVYGLPLGGAGARAPLRARLGREVQAASRDYLKRHHLTRESLLQGVFPSCARVGYVAAKQRRVTAAMVAAPISVKLEPHAKYGPKVKISFTARQPVTSSSSWYAESVTSPRQCQADFSGGVLNRGDVSVGQRLHTAWYLSTYPCKGVYHGVVAYMQDSRGGNGPMTNSSSRGLRPSGSVAVVVGHFSFTIH